MIMFPLRKRWLLWAIVLSLPPTLARASRVDDLVSALSGNDEQARSLARQLLPRQPIEAVPKVLPLLREERAEVRDAAFNVLADCANEVTAPGRAADRAAVTAQLMTLVGSPQPSNLKILGLRLIPIVIPADGDVGPIQALLNDPDLRERAREALEEIGTGSSRSALRQHLATADPEFTIALLNSMGRLRDRESLETIAKLAEHANPRVRAAAARALSWTGDPAHLKTARSVVAAADPATQADATDALLRLLLAMGRQPAHRQAAANGYGELLSTAQGQVRDGVLAGLGRTGNASCVPALLAAIRGAELPTSLVGMNALRTMPGSEVTRALVEAFPGLTTKEQAALIPVLASRRDALVLPLLQQRARSDDPAVRASALEAIGETGLKEAIEVLAAEAKSGDESHRGKAREVMARLAASLLDKRQHGETGTESRETDLHGLLGIIGRWWVVGPFELGENNEGWATNYIGEPQISLVARYMSGKTRREWKRIVSQDAHGKVDLRGSVANRDRCVGYAYAEIVLDQPSDAVLLVGVDDSERIWVNGTKVFEQFTKRGLQVDQDRVPVQLKAGTNAVLLKLYQDTQGWEFCVRVTTPDGRPLAFHQQAD
jgi:HEAT repeat protein